MIPYVSALQAFLVIFSALPLAVSAFIITMVLLSFGLNFIKGLLEFLG